MDFFTVPTIYFKVLYVLVIVSHERQKINHYFAVTSHPASVWVSQQVKEATPVNGSLLYRALIIYNKIH